MIVHSLPFLLDRIITLLRQNTSPATTIDYRQAFLTTVISAIRIAAKRHLKFHCGGKGILTPKFKPLGFQICREMWEEPLFQFLPQELASSCASSQVHVLDTWNRVKTIFHDAFYRTSRGYDLSILAPWVLHCESWGISLFKNSDGSIDVFSQ